MLVSTVPRFSLSAGLDDQANASLLGESMKHVLHTDAIERCEDSLVQAKCRELAKEKQRKYTPAMLPKTPSIGGAEPSTSSAAMSVIGEVST